MSIKDYAGKHSSEWPTDIGDSVIVGAHADPLGLRPYIGVGKDTPVEVHRPYTIRDVVLCVPNRERGGADTHIVISDDGVWIRGLDEYIEKRVSEELAKRT